MAKNQTQVDRWLKRLKNNRVAAAVIVASIAFAGVVQFTRGVGDLLDFMGRRTASDDNSQEKSAGLSARGATAATDAERFTTGEPSPCVTEGGSAAVRAYALAHVDPDGLALFVRQNANLFAVDGAAVKCLQLLC